jgi:hypothetical protein
MNSVCEHVTAFAVLEQNCLPRITAGPVQRPRSGPRIGLAGWAVRLACLGEVICVPGLEDLEMIDTIGQAQRHSW